MNLKEQTLFGFYGSLRKGEYNYMALMKNQEGVKYLATVKIPGYKLYSLGSYPVILPTDEFRTVTIDLFKIDNDTVKNRLDRMEIGAGYIRKEVEVEGNNILIYVGGEHYHDIGEDRLIPDGDWANRNNSRQLLNAEK